MGLETEQSQFWYEALGAHYLDTCITLFGSGTPLGAARICNELRLRELHGHTSTVGQLADAIDVPKSTASRWLADLYEKRVVEFEEDPEDRRRKLVRHRAEFLERLKCTEGLPPIPADLPPNL